MAELESWAKVLELQAQYSPESTPVLQERGISKRDDIPDWIRSPLKEIQSDARIEDLAVEGQDAIGRKSRISHVRVFSELKSSGAPHGWSCVR